MKPKTVVAIAGLPLSGKTTLGDALAKATGIHFVDIDAGPVSCAPPQEPDPLQSEEARAREQARMRVAYTILHAAIEANLAQGFSVIVAATYSRRASQEFLRAAVERAGGVLKVIWCQFSDTPEEIERRVTDRLTCGLVGGCRSASHYLDDKSRYDGVMLPHIPVMIDDNEEGVARAVEQAIAYLDEDR